MASRESPRPGVAPGRGDRPAELDPWHAAVVEAQMKLDAARVSAGESQFIRLFTSHELCVGACLVNEPTLVVVTAIAPGVRTRQPVWTRETAA